MKWFYVYYSYEEWGRGYIGRRECVCHPEEDVNYFGSFKDKSFQPCNKIVLQIFNSREDAIQAEIDLHTFFSVDSDPHFANRSKQTSTRFSGGTKGRRWYRNMEEKKQKMFFPGEEPSGWEKGVLPDSEETRIKKSESHKGLKKTDATIEKHRKASTGRTLSPEAKEKISVANRGRVKKPSQIEAVRKAITGIKRSAETKARMSAAQRGISKGKGVPKSPEHRRKMSEAAKKRTASKPR